MAHKHKIESEALESQLMERQFEVETSKKEIEKHLTEREILEKRVSEVWTQVKEYATDFCLYCNILTYISSVVVTWEM